MSNVLIGIIGVILFIGLALAGALFLGPRFQEATTNSTASAAIQATAQVAQAANLHYTIEGFQAGDQDEGVSGLVDKGYLKSFPSVPRVLGLIANDMVGPYQTKGGTYRVHYAIAAFADDSKGQSICKAINRQVKGSQDITSVTAPASPVEPVGCLRYDGPAIGGTFTGYIAWNRIR